MDINNFDYKFSDCVDCLNKNDTDICEGCNCGELFSESYSLVNFSERNSGNEDRDDWVSSVYDFNDDLQDEYADPRELEL
jgi:hypothetical protein